MESHNFFHRFSSLLYSVGFLFLGKKCPILGKCNNGKEVSVALKACQVLQEASINPKIWSCYFYPGNKSINIVSKVSPKTWPPERALYQTRFLMYPKIPHTVVIMTMSINRFWYKNLLQNRADCPLNVMMSLHNMCLGLHTSPRCFFI